MLNIPGGRPRPDLPVLGSRVPRPDEIIILSAPLLRATVKIGTALKDAQAKWAFGGDAGEIIKGVNVKTDHLEIVTTNAGTEEICRVLAGYVTLPPATAEKRLSRGADFGGKMLPIYIKSHYAELTVDGVRVEVYGDLQFKVAEWDWGDPIDYEVERVNIIGKNVPTLPLRLKSELDLGLGWLDRVELISDAMMRSQHRH
jgi:aminoglycoside-2''-adenylyltransferase